MGEAGETSDNTRVVKGHRRSQMGILGGELQAAGQGNSEVKGELTSFWELQIGRSGRSRCWGK